MLPPKPIRTADGSVVEAQQFILSTLEIGPRTFRNIEVIVMTNLEAPLLLGTVCLNNWVIGQSITLGRAHSRERKGAQTQEHLTTIQMP